MIEKLSGTRRPLSLPLRSKISNSFAARLFPFLSPSIATCVLGFALWYVASSNLSNLQGFRSAFELFLVFVWLAFLAGTARGKLRDLFVVASSLVFGLAALEAIAVKSESASSVVAGKGFFTYKPGIGWGAAAPGSFPARKIDPRSGSVVFDVTYSIDRSLLRSTVSSIDGPTIAFFGDSLTFGEGVNDNETMPQVFADLTDYKFRVLNLGFPGYGPQQALYQLDTGGADALLGPDPRLFVLMTAPWHAERTACKPTYTLRSPRYRSRDGHVESAGPCSDGLTLLMREWVQNTALYRVAVGPYRQRIGRDDIEEFISIVLTTAELAKKKYGVTTLIAYISAGEDYLRQTGYTNKTIIDRFRDAGISVIDMSLEKEKAAGAIIEIPGDGHPTAFAHRARAQALRDYIAEEIPDLASFRSR